MPLGGNKFVQLYVQVQYLAILSFDTLDDQLKKIEGDISLILHVILFIYTETVSAFMLHYLTGL